jgi:hypothetical protein
MEKRAAATAASFMLNERRFCLGEMVAIVGVADPGFYWMLMAWWERGSRQAEPMVLIDHKVKTTASPLPTCLLLRHP